MSIRILVVDDETSVTDLIGYNLRKAHYEILTAHDGETALQLANQEKPDLILLDLMLPKVDGLDVCREVRTRWTDWMSAGKCVKPAMCRLS